MRTRSAIARLFATVCLLGLTAPTCRADDWSGWAGRWSGAIRSGGLELATVMDLAVQDDGTLGGTMDSPQQGAFGLPITSAQRQEDGSVRLVIDAVQATCLLRRLDDPVRLEGTWRQRGVTAPIRLELREGGPVPGQERLAGTWLGRLKAGGIELRVVFDIKGGAGEPLGGVLNSPDQGAFGLPLGDVELDEDGAVRIAIPSVGGYFEGALSDDGQRVAGTFVQAGARLPLELERTGKVEPLPRPQTPRPPFPYRQEEVTFRNDAAGIELAGTLTLPETGGPFAAAVLITGSGGQDRDETIFEHKPFLLIADRLTRAGIAVLRVDDRGVGDSEAGPPGATTADVAADAAAAVDFLAGHERIDAARIGLVGHSEGGYAAIMLAARRPSIAFVALLASPGVGGDELLCLQAERLGRAGGLPAEIVRANRADQERLFAILKDDGLDEAARERRIREAVEAKLPPGTPPGTVQQQVTFAMSPWLRFWVGYDPAADLARIECPVLALTGGLDLQVPAEENLEALRRGLAAGGNPDVTLRELPGLNHLFQTAVTGMPDEYGRIEETFDEDALKLLVDWVVKRAGPPA